VSHSRRIVAAVANHAIWPMPWPSTFTLEWRNRINQHQCFFQSFRLAPVAHRERDAVSIANQMALAPSLGAIRGIWTGLRTAVHRADRAAVNNRSGPIDVAFAGQPIQEREVLRIIRADRNDKIPGELNFVQSTAEYDSPCLPPALAS
jgi:hypothetical protein